MKKLNKIMAAFASLALSAAVFTGCVTDNPDLESLVDLSSFYLRGNMNNWCNDALTDGSLTENPDGTFTITYTAKSNPDEFAIADATWATKYCNGTEVVVDGDFVELAAGGGNAKVTGQVPGNNYKMTIQPLSSSVKVKVELAGSNIPSFYVLDTTKGLVEMPYDGKSYTYYMAPAVNATENVVIWSEGKYYTGSVKFQDTKEIELKAEDEVGYLAVTSLAADDLVKLVLTVTDKKVSVKANDATPENFKVVLKFPETTAEKVVINTSIGWGGVKTGQISVDGKKFGTGNGFEFDIEDEQICFYITKDYDVSGTWIEEQAPKGANFKLEAAFDGGAADGGKWYALALDKDVVELTYEDDWIE